jgi:hypothetical protein
MVPQKNCYNLIFFTVETQRVFFLFLFVERTKRNKPKPCGQVQLFNPFGSKNILLLILPVVVFRTRMLPRSGCPPQADSFVGVSATNEKNFNLCDLCASAVNNRNGAALIRRSRMRDQPPPQVV